MLSWNAVGGHVNMYDNVAAKQACFNHKEEIKLF